MLGGNTRKMVVDVKLENKGENAYNAILNITYSPNLRFSSLFVKVQYLHPKLFVWLVRTYNPEPEDVRTIRKMHI